ncbi:MAG: EscU/YscU/HrcU family type III secretion system export apparatus switch protein [Planctomycetes bacterium]|nr:EscU/YscU/HrcU family type III secretion system export apparatus switch protein [Planctomycetota bacterium]
MPDNEQGERTEQATPRRREEARDRGEVARSHDLSGSVVLFLAFGAMYVMGPWFVNQLKALFILPLARLGDLDASAGGVNAQLTAGFAVAAMIVVPLMVLLAASALFVNFAQVGFHLSSHPFQLDGTKFDPIKGIKRMFSTRALVKLIGGLAKIAVLALVLYFVLRADIPTMVGLLKNFSTDGNGAARIAGFIATEAILVGLYTSLTLVAIGLLDYGYQRWQHTQDLRMTKQEVKEEMRNLEGDPQLRKKRLEIQRKVAKGRMMQDAAQADVMITNPTHYTIALRYKRDDAAPRVVAKGADNLALKLREVARENEIPIIERPELARGLYRWCEVGEAVPQKFWKAAAEVLAFVWSKDKSRRNQLLDEVGA